MQRNVLAVLLSMLALGALTACRSEAGPAAPNGLDTATPRVAVGDDTAAAAAGEVSSAAPACSAPARRPLDGPTVASGCGLDIHWNGSACVETWCYCLHHECSSFATKETCEAAHARCSVQD